MHWDEKKIPISIFGRDRGGLPDRSCPYLICTQVRLPSNSPWQAPVPGGLNCGKAGRSLVEEDEQLDQLNSQTCME